MIDLIAQALGARLCQIAAKAVMSGRPMIFNRRLGEDSSDGRYVLPDSKIKRLFNQLILQIYGPEAATAINKRSITGVALLAPVLGLAADIGQIFGNFAYFIFLISTALFAVSFLAVILRTRMSERWAFPSVILAIFASVFGIFVGGQALANLTQPESRPGTEQGVSSLILPGVSELQTLTRELLAKLTAVETKITTVDTKVDALPKEIADAAAMRDEQRRRVEIEEAEAKRRQKISNFLSRAAWAMPVQGVYEVFGNISAIEVVHNDLHRHKFNVEELEIELTTNAMGRISNASVMIGPNGTAESRGIVQEQKILLPDFKSMVNWFNRPMGHRNLDDYKSSFSLSTLASEKRVLGSATIGDLLGDEADDFIKSGYCRLFNNIGTATCMVMYGVTCDNPNETKSRGNFALSQNVCSGNPGFHDWAGEVSAYYSLKAPKIAARYKLSLMGGDRKFWQSDLGRRWQVDLYTKFYSKLVVTHIEYDEPVAD